MGPIRQMHDVLLQLTLFGSWACRRPRSCRPVAREHWWRRLVQCKDPFLWISEEYGWFMIMILLWYYDLLWFMIYVLLIIGILNGLNWSIKKFRPESFPPLIDPWLNHSQKTIEIQCLLYMDVIAWYPPLRVCRTLEMRQQGSGVVSLVCCLHSPMDLASFLNAVSCVGLGENTSLSHDTCKTISTLAVFSTNRHTFEAIQAPLSFQSTSKSPRT